MLSVPKYFIILVPLIISFYFPTSWARVSIMRFVRHRFGPFPARFAPTMASNDRLLQHGYILTVVPAFLAVGFLIHTFCHRLRMLVW